jgi:hypothetical protein
LPSRFIFDTGEIRHLQHFLQQRADIVQMSKQAVGAFVRFAAENLVLVNAEHIEKILIRACSFRDKVLQHSLNRIELTGADFEVRMQADEV